MGWVLTRGLRTFSAELDAAFPNREKYTDGAKGDSSHAGSVSGHNPDISGRAEYRDGDSKDEVRAIDRDKDLRSTVTMEQVIQYLVRKGRAGTYLPFRYFIYRRRIWRKSTGWKTEAYHGANDHNDHAHFSGDYSQRADEWTGSLGLASLVQKEEDMPLTTNDADLIVERLLEKGLGSSGTPTVGVALQTGAYQNTRAILGALTALSAAVGELDDVDETVLANALAPAVATLIVPALVAAVEANGGAPLTAEQVEEAVKDAMREGTGTE